MKVAIIIPRLVQLGPVLLMGTLIKNLKKEGEVSLKVFYLDKEVDPEINLSVPVELYSSRSLSFGEFDIIHTNGIRPDLIAYVNRKRIRYHISTIHNFVFEDLRFSYNGLISKIFGNIWLRLWSHSDKLVCITGTMKNYYSKWFSQGKLELIYNGIPDVETTFSPEGNVIDSINQFRAQGLKIIGCAGALNKCKGFDQVIKLIHKERSYALIILGEGKERPGLEALAKNMDISDRCIFKGFKTNAVNYFRFFDIIIIPSRTEGFGLVLVEAVQQKVPVICSDIPVFRELFNEGEVTFFRSEDPDSLREAVKTSEKSGKSKTDCAYLRYKEKYTDELMAKRYLELYRSTQKPDQSFLMRT
jgi:L-malate glycosyltransferase